MEIDSDAAWVLTFKSIKNTVKIKDFRTETEIAQEIVNDVKTGMSVAKHALNIEEYAQNATKIIDKAMGMLGLSKAASSGKAVASGIGKFAKAAKILGVAGTVISVADVVLSWLNVSPTRKEAEGVKKQLQQSVIALRALKESHEQL